MLFLIICTLGCSQENSSCWVQLILQEVVILVISVVTNLTIKLFLSYRIDFLFNNFHRKFLITASDIDVFNNSKNEYIALKHRLENARALIG